MNWIVVSLIVTLFTGLSVSLENQPLGNDSLNTNSSIGARYLVHDKIINKTKAFRETILPNGTRLREKIMITEIIDIETNVPDDENFVVSKLVYKVYKMHNQINSSQKTRVERGRNMLEELIAQFKKSEKNKILSKQFRKTLNKYKLLAKSLIRKHRILRKKVLDDYFYSLLHSIAKVARTADSKTVCVAHVDQVIDRFLSNNEQSIRKKKDYSKLLGSIVNTLLKNENNRTKVQSIGSNINKAVEMYNIAKNVEVKEKVFDMIIRTLSLLRYRFKFWKTELHLPQNVNSEISQSEIIINNTVSEENENDPIQTEPDETEELQKNSTLSEISGTEYNNTTFTLIPPEHVTVLDSTQEIPDKELTTKAPPVETLDEQNNSTPKEVTVLETTQETTDKTKELTTEVPPVETLGEQNNNTSKQETTVLEITQETTDKTKEFTTKPPPVETLEEKTNNTPGQVTLLDSTQEVSDTTKAPPVETSEEKTNNTPTQVTWLDSTQAVSDTTKELTTKVPLVDTLDEATNNTPQQVTVFDSTQETPGRTEVTTNPPLVSDEENDNTPITLKPPKQDTMLEIPSKNWRKIIKEETRLPYSSCTHKKDRQIESIITKIIEREETRRRLKNIFPKNLVDLLNANRDQSKIKNKIIQQYKKYRGNKRNSNNIEKLTDRKNLKIVSSFENDLLDTLMNGGNQVVLNKIVKRKIRQLLYSKDFGSIKIVTHDHIKQLLRELGYKVADNECLDKDCLKESEHIRNELKTIASLQEFNKYRNGKLHVMKFATNIIHARKNKAVRLYKAFDAEYENNHYSEYALAKVLSNKIKLFQKIVRYLAVLKKVRNETLYLPKEKRIMFNANPLKPNKILFQQNEYDKGYFISIRKPNVLVDASVQTVIKVKDLNASLVKETEALGPYINKGDPLPGELIAYKTMVSLEFISEKNFNVKVLIEMVQKEFKLNCYRFDLNLPQNIRVQGKIVRVAGHHIHNCKTLEWKMKNVHIEDFDMNAKPSEDLSNCNYYGCDLRK